MPTTPEKHKECVGSLVVNSTDVQELSEAPLKIPKAVQPSGEMVGSLLVQSDELKELEGQAAKSGKDSNPVVDRIAEDIHSPTSDDFNPWANH